MAWCSGGHRQWCQSRGQPAPPSGPRFPWGRAFGRLHAHQPRGCAVVQHGHQQTIRHIGPFTLKAARGVTAPSHLLFELSAPPHPHTIPHFHPSASARRNNRPVGCAGCWPAPWPLWRPASPSAPGPYGTRQQNAQPGHRSWPCRDACTQGICRSHPRDRKDAASHLYSHNQQRIYKGKLPPCCTPFGVLEVDIDRQGRVTRLHWIRPATRPRWWPRLNTVRAAAPTRAQPPGQVTAPTPGCGTKRQFPARHPDRRPALTQLLPIKARCQLTSPALQGQRSGSSPKAQAVSNKFFCLHSPGLRPR